jgi:DNA-binding PadR family transcriptional regulator
MPAPTTTSYAILSLLAVRSWTAYELAQQMDRSVGSMWPRAESVVYEEPKRLVQLGLASSRRELTGRRASTVYSITPKGRRRLAEWLERPGAGPTTEFEGLLKIAFADHGSIEGLRANIAAIRAWADQEAADTEERRREYAETGGPYPDRLPVIALAYRYFAEQAEAVRRWADWVDAATSDWTGTTAGDGAVLPADAWEPPVTAPVVPPAPPAASAPQRSSSR